MWARYTRGGKQFVWDVGQLARAEWGWADYDSLWQRPGNAGSMLPPNGSPKRALQHSYGYQQATAFIGYKQDITDNLDIDYAFSYDMFDYERVQSEAISDAYREDEYYGKILMKWQINDKHRIAFGTELSHHEFGLRSPGWPVDNDFPRSSQLNPMPRWATNMYSLVGEHQWTINDKWTTFAGARLDRHTFTSWMFSPRLAVVHTPNDKDTFKLMWARSVRSNFDQDMKATALSDGGDSEAEKLDSIEFRYERQHNENLDLAASVFVHYALQLVDWQQIGTFGTTTNIGTQRDYGFELEAAYHTEKTRLILSHSYTKLYGFFLADPTTVTFVTAEPYGFGNDLTNWSNHSTKLAFQQKLNDKWTFDASLRIYWKFPGMNDYNKYNPYAQANGALAGTMNTTHKVIKDGWDEAYEGNYYLNLGLQYKPNKDLTIGITGYNLLGIFNPKLNKRNYLNSYGDYRCQAPAVGVSLTYKF